MATSQPAQSAAMAKGQPNRQQPTKAAKEAQSDIPIAEKIVIGVANILSVSPNDILLYDSFMDLGGNIAGAIKLSADLAAQGIILSPDDVVRCKTIAELQTQARTSASPSHSATDPDNRLSAESEQSSTLRHDGVFTPTRDDLNTESVYGPVPDLDLTKKSKATNADDAATDPPQSAKSKGKQPAQDDDSEHGDNELEEYLESVSYGDPFCLVQAEKGPFEKQLIAFVSLKSEEAKVSKGIGLPSETDYSIVEERIKLFYSSLREWDNNQAGWPDVWVPLRAMVLKGNGQPAVKALQWWLKNMDEEAEQRVLSLQRLLTLQLMQPMNKRSSTDKTKTPKGQARREQENEEEAGKKRREKLEQDRRRRAEKRKKIEDRLRREAIQAEKDHKRREAELAAARNKALEPQIGSVTDFANEEPPARPDIVVSKPKAPVQHKPGLSVDTISIHRGTSPPRPLTRSSSRRGPPKSIYSRESFGVAQEHLSTIRPEKTFSMWIEDEAGKFNTNEQMGVASDEVAFFPLSAMQQLFFRTAMNLNPKASTISEEEYRFSQSIMLQVQAGLESSDIEKALESLVERHSMLRCRFRLTREGWAQVILSETQNSYHFGHHQTEKEEDIAKVIEGAHASINPVQGPVFSAEHIRTHDNKQYLFLVAHHLTVDLASWRIIIHDLDELLREGSVLSQPSIPFSNWIEYQGYETSHRLVQPKLPFEIAPPQLGYWDLDLDSNRYGRTEQFEFKLSAELTYTLRSCSRSVFRTDPADVFLTALLLSFCQTFPDRPPPTMWTQEHGRESRNSDFNIDETVGWFTALCPINISASQHSDLMELLKLMKDTRKAIPDSGVSFFNSEFQTPSEPFTSIPVEIMFSCVDKLHKLHRKDGVLEPVSAPQRVSDTLTSDIGADVGRIALFEISISIEDAEASIEALYIKPKRQDYVKQWFGKFESLVNDAIVRLRDMSPELTLSDAPLLRTSYANLTRLATKRVNEMGLDNVGDIETILPVNPSQQEILIAQGQDPESFYVHAICELHTPDGRPISQGKLCAAWANLVSDHNALRSLFIDSVSEDGLFDQVVLLKTSPDMLFVDGDDAAATLSALPAMKKTPGQPRHRLSVCKSENKTYIRLDASQALFDAVALDGLLTRLRMAYAGEEPQDHDTLLQTHLFDSNNCDTSYNLQSWRGLLSNSRPCIFPSLTQSKASHQLQSRYFPLNITRKELHQFSVDREYEPTYVLQLAWAMVLRAYVGMDQVTFGYEVSGRDESLFPGIRHEIGSFAWLSPCTVDASPNRTLSECLQSLAEVASVARQSHNPTLSEIHDAIKIGTADLFNTCMSVRDFDNARNRYPELEADSFRASLVTSGRNSDCTVSLSAMFINDHLHVDISFRDMTPTQAQNIVHTFERAARLVMENPAIPITAAELFTDRDYAQLVVQDFEFTLKDEKANQTVHQLILRHAQEAPQAQAIMSWDGKMTYHQMSYCITVLASYLRNIGVAPGLAVPVVLEKNKWAPVIILSVLKAGGSIVCLDAQDKSHIETIIKGLGSRIVVATESAWNDIVCIVPNLVIVNERFFSTLPPQVSIPMQEATPDHGACVLYTPGSGKSKGASTGRSLFFTHASLCSAFLAQGPALKLDRESRVLQLSAFSVDIALVEILGTMVHGGCVCIPSAKERLHNLGIAINRMNVTWSYMTSAVARRIDPDNVPSVKTVCFRTRRLDEDTRKAWLKSKNILLAYGAPEVCPLGVAIAQVSDESTVTVIPQPLMGRFWILNPEDRGKLMPLGAIGELAIDCPMLTPHKFFPGQNVVVSTTDRDSTSRPTRARYLKTGHRVRYLDDGSIQFISSMRDDVFLDGSPVLATDIEQHLRRCLGQKVDVIVETVTTSDNIQLLAAFLELSEHLISGSSDVEKLQTKTKERSQILKSLHDAGTSARGISPSHIPTVFIPLKQFPLSSSLKVNRRKLQKMVATIPYMELLGMSSKTEEQPEKPLPLTHVEERMRHVWAGVLDVQPAKIKSNDSILGHGGNRWIATKLVVACRKSSLTVCLNDLLKGATLTEVCQAIAASEITPNENHRSGEGRSTQTGVKVPGFDEKFIRDAIAPIMKVHRNDILDIADASCHQIRGLETRMYGKKAAVKCLVFNFNGPVRAQKLQTACETLVRLHPIFRTGFAVRERHVYQVLLDGFKPEFQRYPCPGWCLGSVADNVVAEDQDFEFKPETPTTKFTYLDAGQQGTLIVRLSTALIDEASIPLLVHDLAALYEGQGNLSSKPSFLEYMRSAQAANDDAGVEYWRDLLDGAKMTQFVAHNRPYRPASDIRTLTQTVEVDPVSEYGLSWNTVVKAGWAIVLATYSASSDVVFGEVTQGMNIKLPDHFDVASLIGPTTNTVPVRVKFSKKQDTPIDFMRRISDQRMASRQHESIGMLELVQRCTDWSYWTRFSTVVYHRHQAPVDTSTTLNMGDTTFTYSAMEPGTQDIPDIMVTTSMEGPGHMTCELKFSESRVPPSFAEEALRMLTIAIDILTSEDTIEKPMIQSSVELARSPAKIPLAKEGSTGSDKVAYYSLPHDERQALQSLISAVWTEILDPTPLGVPQTHTHKANFYDLWGSVLPAHWFAERLNAEFSKQPIRGLHQIQVSPAEMVENPSMSAQYELVVSKMFETGVIPNSIKRRTINWGYSQNSGQSNIMGTIPEGTTTWKPDQPAPQNNSIRKGLQQLRGSSGSVRQLGSKAGDWVRRHRSGLSRDAATGPKGVNIGDPVATELPPRAMVLANQQRANGTASPPAGQAWSSPPSSIHVPGPGDKPVPMGRSPTPMIIRSMTPGTNLDAAPTHTSEPIMYELDVSPMSSSTPRRRSTESNDSDPASPVSPLGPAWLAV